MLTTVAAAFLAMFVAACDSSGTNDPPEEVFDRGALLENIGNNLIFPTYGKLLSHVEDLEIEADQFLQNPSVSSLADLREGLKQARLTWQEASFFQFGPAQTVALRGVLNTFPANVDQINSNITSGNYVLGSIENLPAGGFPALGYLIYGDGLTDEDIVGLYTTDQNAASRIKYLRDNTEFISEIVLFVANEWGSGGNYLNTFLDPDNAGTDVGSSLGEVVNAMILHFERFSRDGKIGIPAGVRSAGVPRPRATEAFYAGYSAELAGANLEGLLRLYTGVGENGQGGTSLADNLGFLGASDLAVDIETAFAESLAAVSGLTDPLSTQLEGNVDEALVVFTKMQELVVLMKVDMASRLGITITFQDNDGD
ncbi:MAG: imelysin family protein [Rhodothermales bacterium]